MEFHIEMPWNMSTFRYVHHKYFTQFVIADERWLIEKKRVREKRTQDQCGHPESGWNEKVSGFE